MVINLTIRPRAYADCRSRPGRIGRMADVLAQFGVATREWFAAAFAAPTAAQAGAWRSIGAGHNALVVAPTGSGKTLAAFLWSLDRLAREPRPADPRHRCRVLYVSPLKALAVDVERNLRAPLAGIRQAATRLALPPPEITVGMRTGDTPADERRAFARTPPDILITTPESLFLLLTSAARDSLRGRGNGDRRRGARGRRHQARRPSGALPGTPRRTAAPTRPSGSGSPPRSGRSTPPPASSPAPGRWTWCSPAPRRPSRSASRCRSRT